MNQFLETTRGLAIAALLLIGMSSSVLFGGMLHNEDIDNLPATYAAWLADRFDITRRSDSC